jgi:hypothetical protein
VLHIIYQLGFVHFEYPREVEKHRLEFIVNYQKLDAAIATALHNIRDPEDHCLLVFIHTEPTLTPDAITILEQLGVDVSNSRGGIFTATLSVNNINRLSDQSWVYYIKLSQHLYPLTQE